MLFKYLQATVSRLHLQLSSRARLLSDSAYGKKFDYSQPRNRNNYSRHGDSHYGNSRNFDGSMNRPNFNRFNKFREQPLKPIASLPPNLTLNKSFLESSDETNKTNQEMISNWINENQVTIKGNTLVKPILEIDELNNIPKHIFENVKKLGFERPTCIQSIAWPLALSGTDLVAISQTGSGKTLGFILPALVHIEGNQHRQQYGPNVLVLAPTRELVQQIRDVVKSFHFARAVCVFGGASKDRQRQEINNVKPSIIVACPGRLLDFVREGSITLQNISYLVLDEADRMLDMGFEDQIREIIEKIPKERQTLMWSATWPKEVRQLANDFLDNYCEVNIGSTDLTANHNITQIVHVCQEEEKIHKLHSLMQELKLSSTREKTLIFAETKRKVDFLERQLQKMGCNAKAIHGDKSQLQRDTALKEFRNNQVNVLIATDVAARGLDVRDIKYVINYDYPNNSENYVHRIGRTGRHGQSGTAYTFVTDEDARQMQQLISVLQEAKQEVSDDLHQLSYSSNRSGKSSQNRFYKSNDSYRNFGKNRYNNSYGNNRYNNSYGNNRYNNSYGNNRYNNSYGNNGYNNYNNSNSRYNSNRHNDYDDEDYEDERYR